MTAHTREHISPEHIQTVISVMVAAPSGRSVSSRSVFPMPRTLRRCGASHIGTAAHLGAGRCLQRLPGPAAYARTGRR
jgi:hypothetical protein